MSCVLSETFSAFVTRGICEDILNVVLEEHQLAMGEAVLTELRRVLDKKIRRATLVTSQLPFDHWHAVAGDATFADAILDRLVHNAQGIALKGPPCADPRPLPHPPTP